MGRPRERTDGQVIDGNGSRGVAAISTGNAIPPYIEACRALREVEQALCSISPIGTGAVGIQPFGEL